MAYRLGETCTENSLKASFETGETKEQFVTALRLGEESMCMISSTNESRSAVQYRVADSGCLGGRRSGDPPLLYTTLSLPLEKISDVCTLRLQGYSTSVCVSFIVIVGFIVENK